MASIVFGKADRELLSFDSYELAELAAKFISGKVLTREAIYINVSPRQNQKNGGPNRVCWYLTKMKTDKSEEGYWLAGEFFNS